MNRLKVYRDMKAKRITLEEAAVQLGLIDKDLKFRMTRHGSKFPAILLIMDKIENDTVTRGEAAEELGVGERQVNQLMQKWGVKRPLRDYIITRTSSAVKWELRKHFAIEYIADDATIDDAAESGGVSTRQMRRWVSDLLYKHFEMPFKDLKLVSRLKRQKLADEVAVAEGLELAKQRVAESIAEGEKTIKEEALERVLSRRSMKGRHVQQ